MGKFRLKITTQPLEWSDRKLAMVANDIKIMLSQEGVPNAQIDVERLDGEEQKQERKNLDLICGGCGRAWSSEVFVPCPGCGARAGVRKQTLEEIAASEAVKSLPVLGTLIETPIGPSTTVEVGASPIARGGKRTGSAKAAGG